MKKLTELSDESLVSVFVKGNNTAFDTLLKRYESKVFSYIQYAVNNQELANDLFQDVFVRVITTLRSGKYVETGKFGSWLMRITHNILIDYFRQSSQIKGVSKDDDKKNILNDVHLMSDSGTDDYLIDHQLLSDIKHFIAKLPETQREAIVMRFFYEMSFKDIAEATGVSINTALGRTRYGLMALRRMAETCNIQYAS